MALCYPTLLPPESYLRMIGYICTWWQQIEFLVESTIWLWAGVSQKRGRCLTAHMPFPLRCDVLRSLASAKFNNRKYDAALGKFIENKLKTTNTVRNRFAHALWLSDHKDSTWLIEIPDRLKPDLEQRQIDARELIAACAKILDTWADLMLLVSRINDGSFEPDSWQKKSDQPIEGYDQIIAARSHLRAMQGKRPRRPKSSPA